MLLCDSGVDSMLKHDEEALGTVAEDLLTMLAVHKLHVPAMLMCVGLGTEEGVGERDFLRNWAALQRRRAPGDGDADGDGDGSGDCVEAYLGCFAWHPSMKGVKEYMNAIKCCIPSTQIVSSLEGIYGHNCPTSIRNRFRERDADLAVFVNPLMSLCCFFDFDAVMASKLFIDEEMYDCRSVLHVHSLLEARRADAGLIRVDLCAPTMMRYDGDCPYHPIFERIGEEI